MDSESISGTEEAEEGLEQPRRPWGAGCAFSAGLLLILLYSFAFGFGKRDDVLYLWYPLETVLKVAGSDLDAIDSGRLEQDPGVWGRILGGDEDVRQKALDGFADELKQLGWQASGPPSAVLCRIILELEASGWSDSIQGHFEAYSLGPASEVVLRYAYAEGSKPAAAELSAFNSYLGSGHWYSDTVRRRIAELEANTSAADSARKRMSGRVDRLMAVGNAQQWMSLALGALGVLALGGWCLRSGPLAEARWAAQWSFGSGMAVSALAAAVYLWHPFFFSVFDLDTLWGGLASLAVIWVLRPKDGPGFLPIFGLTGRSWRLIAVVTWSGILVDQLLTAIWTVGLWGDQVGWGFYDEWIFWGSRWMVITSLLNGSLFAPVFEELIFRGVFYGTLRTRLRMWPALVLNALFFTVWHGYNLEGSAWIFASGLLFAYLYERSRSLIPPMIVHGFMNLMISIYILAV